jgi:phosphate transport system substrate-binding protein
MRVFKRVFLYSLVLFIPLSVAQAGVSGGPSGPAFSDPSHVADVGPDFQSRLIEYDKGVGKVDVVITLGQQTYPALHKIVEDIARQQGIAVDIQQGSCGATAKKLLKKSVDIGTYCCPPGKTDRLPGLVFHTIAIAPIALTTNSANPINSVTLAEARKIFVGDYVTWSEVPEFHDTKNLLSTEKIQPVVRLHCKKRPGHWRLLLDNQDMFSPRIQSVATITDMVKQVSENKNAIGYEVPFMLKVHRDSGQLKLLSIDGNSPDDLYKLLKGEYPLYRTYNMTTWSNANNKNEKAAKLLAAIRDYVEKNGAQYDFIPASQLRLAGWKFKGDELVGEPSGSPIVREHQ